MIEIRERVSLAEYSTFRIGGPARYFAEALHVEEIQEALLFAKERHLKVFFLGGGSNILFTDKGFDGLVLKFSAHTIDREGTMLAVDAGAKLLDVVRFACDAGLSGIEYLAGIPGTLGGAIRGNAGAFGAEIGSFVAEVTALRVKELQLQTLSREECNFAYRQSVFKKHPEWIVVSAKLLLGKGNASELNRIADETIAKREAKHPQDVRCAGSFFMNPPVKDAKLLSEFESDTGNPSRNGVLPAGWVIDHVGLRGKRVGGAQVSSIHPNYILNTGGATAEDVIILSSIIKQKVRTQLGIRLKEEVQMVGF